MSFLRERLALFIKWVIGGLVFGAIAGTLYFSMFVLSPAAPDNSGAVDFAIVGALSSAILFLAIALFRELMYEASSEVQLRKAAEKHDPKLVHGFMVDIEKGDDGTAWGAIAMLANYRDPQITEDLLKSVINRLNNSKVLTLDRYAILRHTIKAIQNTRSVPNTRKLELLLQSDNPDVSSMAIRLGVGAKGKTNVMLDK